MGGNTTLTQNAIIQGGLTVSGQSKNGGNGDVIIASNRVVIQGMNSNLVVNGTITSQNSDVKIGTPNVVGQPVTEKTLTVNGNINGKQIGRFYEVLGTLPVNIITNVAYAASSIVQYSAAVPFGCNTSDQIVSCEADWGAIPTAAPITAEWFAARSGNSCQVLARKKNAADANFVGPRARTMCFSPDG